MNKNKQIYPSIYNRRGKGTSKDSIKGWRAIRETILERDGYCCRICNISGGEDPLNVHHIDWNRTNNSDSNLVTLCTTCHRQVHLEGYKPCDHPDHPTPWGEHPI